MAQNYLSVLDHSSARDALYDNVPQNFEVLRSSWSGNAFPANPVVGQPCYRVDEDKLYYWDGNEWSEKGGGSAEMKTMELEASTTATSTVTLVGARCMSVDMMFVFVEHTALDPSQFYLNSEGTVLTFVTPIEAGLRITLRWFNTDVGLQDTAFIATDDELYTGTATNKVPNVKQFVTSLNSRANTDLSNLTTSAATNLNTKGIRTVVETWSSGASWYRVWSDGWIEQGGNATTTASATSLTITLYKPFLLADCYHVSMLPFVSASAVNNLPAPAIEARPTNYFTCSVGSYSGRLGAVGFTWYACGY